MAIWGDFRGGKWPVYRRPMDNTMALASYPVAACAAPKSPFPSAQQVRQQVAKCEIFAGFQGAFCCQPADTAAQTIDWGRIVDSNSQKHLQVL